MIYTKQDLINIGIDYYKKYGKQPGAKTWTVKTAGCSRDRVYELYPSWVDYLKDLKQHIPEVKIPKKPSILSDKELLCLLVEFKQNNHRSPTKKEFKNNDNLPDSSIYESRFGSWNKALEAAGLEINNYHSHYSKEILISKILDYIADTGNLPTIRGFKYSSTCIRHFGSLNKAIEAAGFEPNIQNGFGVDTYGLDGHLYRSQAEAYFADNFLFGNYDYTVEPKYPYPHNKFYDWYVKELDLYIELDGGLRPETTKEKIEINKQLNRNCIFYNTYKIYSMKCLNIGDEEAGSSAAFGAQKAAFDSRVSDQSGSL
jgi:hypothetical protein